MSPVFLILSGILLIYLVVTGRAAKMVSAVLNRG